MNVYPKETRRNRAQTPKKTLLPVPYANQGSGEGRNGPPQKDSNRGLAPSTQGKYRQIRSRIQGKDPVEWLIEVVGAAADPRLNPEHTVTQRYSQNTVNVLRAAVLHELIQNGYSEADAQATLSSLRLRGRRGGQGRALTDAQLTMYRRAVRKEVPSPIRDLLLLLPLTGLRIGAACALRVRHVRRAGTHTVLAVRGKGGKDRLIPLGARAVALVEARCRGGRDTPLFPSRKRPGQPVTPQAVRVWTRRIAAHHKGLEGLHPHQLRHTYITRLLANGGNLAQLKALAGHANVQTTMRYAHPGLDELATLVQREG